jgi:hypothetical protein
VQVLARTFTEAAVLTLVECLKDPRHRVSAAVALLDRGWGRPTQPLAGDEERPPAVITFQWAAATPPDAAAGTEAATDDRATAPAPLVLAWEAPKS